MTKRTEPNTQSTVVGTDGNGAKSHRALVADIIIANAPDPVFVSDLEGKILQANDAVSLLLGFRQDEVLEQSLSRFISAKETREFTAALREVVERGVTRNARLNPRSASGEVIPTTLNASALRDQDRPGPGVRLRPRGQDPAGQRRGLRLAGVPPGRTDRAVALAHHLAGGDARVPGGPARGRGARGHAERAAQPP